MIPLSDASAADRLPADAKREGDRIATHGAARAAGLAIARWGDR